MLWPCPRSRKLLRGSPSCSRAAPASSPTRTGATSSSLRPLNFGPSSAWRLRLTAGPLTVARLWWPTHDAYRWRLHAPPRTRWQGGRCTLEEVGDMAVHVLIGSGGGPEGRRSLSEMGAPAAPNVPVDLNLLRDWSEWRLVATCVEEAEAGAIVLVDGDLQPDWRIPAHWLAGLLTRAAERNVSLVGIIKHSSLARGGAPLVGQLELEAEAALGPRHAGGCRSQCAAPRSGRACSSS